MLMIIEYSKNSAKTKEAFTSLVGNHVTEKSHIRRKISLLPLSDVKSEKILTLPQLKLLLFQEMQTNIRMLPLYDRVHMRAKF